MVREPVEPAKKNPQGSGWQEVVVREPVEPAKKNPQGSELIKSVELKPPKGRN
ncbi:MAG: hypothetical protein PUE21_06085 [Lachnospiraceae bacterium]|nr:hypothetical protein [Lachnospiraceae bacterium]